MYQKYKFEEKNIKSKKFTIDALTFSNTFEGRKMYSKLKSNHGPKGMTMMLPLKFSLGINRQ